MAKVNFVDFDAVKQVLFTVNTLDDLRKINDLVKARANYIQRKSAYEFFKGMKASFVSNRTGETIVGTIVKVNQKTVDIETKDGRSWKVSATMVTRV